MAVDMVNDDLKSMCDEYVFFSYLPRIPEASLDWLDCDFGCNIGKGIENEAWWVREGVRAWKQTMSNQISRTADGVTHIIPLSGGLDSRAILGGLLENLPSSQVIAVTYGIPGTWDYEIGKQIAQKYSLRHEPFNLYDVKWDFDQMVAIAAQLDNPVDVQQCFLRSRINTYFGTDCIYWSGFMGDSIAGSDLPKVQNKDRRQAILRFISLYPTLFFKDQIYQDMMVERINSECPWERLDQKKFGLDQQLDFGIRQRLLTRSIVIVKGYDFRTPFLCKPWNDYISNVPYRWLLDKVLYKQVLLSAYADLFSLPTSSYYGVPLKASKSQVYFKRVKTWMSTRAGRVWNFYPTHPRTNYLDFGEAIREKGDLQDLVYQNIQDLISRDLYTKTQIDKWWRDHQDRKRNNTVLLMNLSSLNILLKANRL
jgi:hypothetical protein